jgi:regulatory protein
LNVEREIVKKAGIRSGEGIDVGHLNTVVDECRYHRCYEAALSFLEHRLRTEAELRAHLVAVRKFDAELALHIIGKLKEVGLVNDRAFAEALVRERSSSRSRSRLMIKRELLQKGVDVETASDATVDVNDEEGAFVAGLKKARLIKSLERGEFFRRMAGYLARRGYGPYVVRSVSDRLWQHLCDSPTEE